MKKSITIDESINKIKFMMNYDSEKTLTEQQNPSDTGSYDESPVVQQSTNTAPQKYEVGDGYLNRIIRQLKRNFDRIDNDMRIINGYTYKGKPAIEELKTRYKTNYKVDIPNYSSSSPTAGANNTTGVATATADAFKPAQGTPEDPFVQGTSGDGVSKVQQYLGGLKVDGMFGPKTQAILAQKVPQFKDKFTNNDLITIYKTLYPQQPISKIDTSKNPNLAAQANTTQLAGQPTAQNLTAYNND